MADLLEETEAHRATVLLVRSQLESVQDPDPKRFKSRLPFYPPTGSTSTQSMTSSPDDV